MTTTTTTDDITQDQAISELEAAFPTATVFASRQRQSTFHKRNGIRSQQDDIHVSVMDDFRVNTFRAGTLRLAVDLAIAKGGIE